MKKKECTKYRHKSKEKWNRGISRKFEEEITRKVAEESGIEWSEVKMP